MMQQPAPGTYDLPFEACPLGLELSFPISCLPSVQNGYESRDQDDKWSVYYRKPWIQIWRPSAEGLYCYAVRLEKIGSHRVCVAESWAGSQILDAQIGLGSDLERHREIVTSLLDFVAGISGKRFVSAALCGTRERKAVTFSGEAKSLQDVDDIAEQLRVQVTQMMKDCRQ